MSINNSNLITNFMTMEIKLKSFLRCRKLLRYRTDDLFKKKKNLATECFTVSLFNALPSPSMTEFEINWTISP